MARESGSSPDPPAAGEPSPDLHSLLTECRRSLDRGDYGLVLRRLDPLVAVYPSGTAEGAELQMLMATAWMGLGDSGRAIACCQLLRRSSDPGLRAQARELLAVLEAPALERPRDWSITLPELSDAEAVQGRVAQLAGRRRSSQPPPPPPPPVGPTRANLGFALMVAALMLLAVLLGGCVQVRGEIHFPAPGRLQLGYTLMAEGGRPSPWQRQFGDYLAGHGFQVQGVRAPAPQVAQQHWRAAPWPADAALAHLSADLAQAARLAGLDLPPPVLRLQERNLLLGVRQALAVELDLTPLSGVVGLDLALDFDPVALRAVQLAMPLPARPGPGRRSLRWPLQPGALNRLELHCWRWSRLGLGSLAVAAALALALALQSLRRAIAPPLPQLPA